MPIINPDYDKWDAPDELYALIADKKLRQRDRVELVIAFYASSHGGNSPTFEQIGKVMGIDRANAYRFAMELTREHERRAIKKNGKFWLIHSKYSHPIIEARFAGVLQE